MNNLQNKNILIIGLGIIGGSYAKGFKAEGILPYGYDIDERTLEIAKELGIIHEETDLITNIQKADIIILCLYPKLNINWLIEYQKYIKPGAVVTDVTGVKTFIIKEVKKIIRSDIEFVPSHPMAGKEASGIEGSNPEVFEGANFIIVPMEDNSYEAIELIKDIAKCLKFKNIEILSPKSHDELISFLSQLTHVIAVSLMNSHNVENMIRYTGDSFRDLTRIAKINENLWTELFIHNKKQLVEDINSFMVELEAFKKLLEEENVDSLKNKMINATNKRKLFDKDR